MRSDEGALKTNDEENKVQTQKKVKKKELRINTGLSKFQEDFMSNMESKNGINNMEDLEEILWFLKCEVGETFNNNIMKIALNMKEEKIASLIVAYYNCKLADEMVLRAVKTQ
jgi:hypothetical protein